MNHHNGGLGCGVLGVRGCKGALGRRLRRLNRLQAPDLGFSSHRPDSPSPLGRLAELVTYSSTRIPLRLAESLLGFAESTPKLRVFFPFLVFKTLGVTRLLPKSIYFCPNFIWKPTPQHWLPSAPYPFIVNSIHPGLYYRR